MESLNSIIFKTQDLENMCNIFDLLASQSVPDQSGGHMQVNSLIPSMHVAEFLHGLLEHSSKSSDTKQNKKKYKC